MGFDIPADHHGGTPADIREALNVEAKRKRQRQSQLEDEILDLIQQRDDYTTSDLQGIVAALVEKIARELK